MSNLIKLSTPRAPSCVKKTKAEIIRTAALEVFGSSWSALECVMDHDNGWIAAQLDDYLSTDPFDGVPCAKTMYSLSPADINTGINKLRHWHRYGWA